MGKTRLATSKTLRIKFIYLFSGSSLPLIREFSILNDRNFVSQSASHYKLNSTSGLWNLNIQLIQTKMNFTLPPNSHITMDFDTLNALA